MYLIYPMPWGSTHIVRTYVVCCVRYLPSADLWCCSQGWQRFWLLTSFILWPHSPCSRSCVSQSFPGAFKCLPSTLLCFSNAFQFLTGALQYISLPDHLCCLAVKCSSCSCLLPVMCLLDACLKHVSPYLLPMFCLMTDFVFVHLTQTPLLIVTLLVCSACQKWSTWYFVPFYAWSVGTPHNKLL